VYYGIPHQVKQRAGDGGITAEDMEKSQHTDFNEDTTDEGWLGSRVVSVLDSGAEGPEFKSQSRRCRVTVFGKLFTPIVPLFTKQQNWQQPF